MQSIVHHFYLFICQKLQFIKEVIIVLRWCSNIPCQITGQHENKMTFPLQETNLYYIISLKHNLKDKIGNFMQMDFSIYSTTIYSRNKNHSYLLFICIYAY